MVVSMARIVVQYGLVKASCEGPAMSLSEHLKGSEESPATEGGNQLAVGFLPLQNDAVERRRLSDISGTNGVVFDAEFCGYLAGMSTYLWLVICMDAVRMRLRNRMILTMVCLLD